VPACGRQAPAGKHVWVLELGPRLNFTTAWSTNCVSILRVCAQTSIPRHDAPPQPHSVCGRRLGPALSRPRCVSLRVLAELS
jgi:hypothetical protein